MQNPALNRWQAGWDGINVVWFLPVPPVGQSAAPGGVGRAWNTSASDVHARLPGILPPTVMEHAVRTAGLARSLAAAHALDPERAEVAGLVHELADGYTDAQLLALAGDYGIAVGPTEDLVPRLLHGPAGAQILRFQWGVDDSEILSAVREHVTGAFDASPLAKVLFLADKLDAERDTALDQRDALETLAERNLDRALLHIASRCIQGLVSQGRPLDERLITTRNRLLRHQAQDA